MEQQNMVNGEEKNEKFDCNKAVSMLYMEFVNGKITLQEYERYLKIVKDTHNC